MGLESKSLSGELVVMAGVCTHHGVTYPERVIWLRSVLSQKEKPLLVRRYGELGKINLLISSSPQSRLQHGQTEGCPCHELPWGAAEQVQHRVYLLKDLLV